MLFFRKEMAGCLSAAERALALNPLDASNEAMFLITFTGDWERGCALIRPGDGAQPPSSRLVPAGPRHQRVPPGATTAPRVDEVVKANSPEVFWTHMLLAAAHGQLGELAAARKALRDLLAQKADFAESARETARQVVRPATGRST